MNAFTRSLALTLVLAAGTLAHAAPGKDKSAPAAAPEKPKVATPAAAPAETKPDQPGPQHEWLHALEGEWQTVTTSYAADGTAAGTDKGTMTNKMEMGGRFLSFDLSGRAGGKFFHEVGLLGYNNTAKRYELVAGNSLSTAMEVLTGQVDKAGKVLTLSGDMTQPDGTKATLKSVITINSKTSLHEDVFQTVAGKESKVQSTDFTKGKVPTDKPADGDKNKKPGN